MSVGPKLGIVTATLDVVRAFECYKTWDPLLADVFVVVQSGGHEALRCHRDGNFISYCLPEICGTVKPFMVGSEIAAELGAELILCIHDDVEILDRRWRQLVKDWYWSSEPGFFGFGGALGLADPSLVHDGRLEAHDLSPDEVVQRLARRHFVSNMRDAEAHGRRVEQVTQVACLDGFSIGGQAEAVVQGWQKMDQIGIVHHAYDSAFGCWAKRLRMPTYMLPVSCHHRGGVTAVGDSRYQDWARENHGGDAEVWLQAHRALYREFRKELPIT